MKHTLLFLLLAASTAAACAQSPAKTATPAKSAATDYKLPSDIPPVKGAYKTLYTIALRYQDVQTGTGAEALPGKVIEYSYTLWLAADGRKIDSTDDHRAPVLDKNRKPVLDANGKPELGDPQKARTVMGMGRPIPGWDMGFEGMKVGGKRRVFIPWQLGLGAREIPGRDASHPGIPAKSDLILDIELSAVTELPQPPSRPSGMPGANPAPGAPAAPKPAAPVTPATPPTPSTPAAPQMK